MIFYHFITITATAQYNRNATYRFYGEVGNYRVDVRAGIKEKIATFLYSHVKCFVAPRSVSV